MVTGGYGGVVPRNTGSSSIFLNNATILHHADVVAHKIYLHRAYTQYIVNIIIINLTVVKKTRARADSLHATTTTTIIIINSKIHIPNAKEQLMFLIVIVFLRVVKMY